MKEKAKDKEILSPDDKGGTVPHSRVLQVITYRTRFKTKYFYLNHDSRIYCEYWLDLLDNIVSLILYKVAILD